MLMIKRGSLLIAGTAAEYFLVTHLHSSRKLRGLDAASNNETYVLYIYTQAWKEINIPGSERTDTP
jgi:hypothetical protein